MLFLLLSVVFSASTLALFRFFKQWNINNLQAITLNYVVASAFGFMAFGAIPRPSLILQKAWFPMALLMAFLFIGSFFLLALSSQKAGVSATAIASRMSVVIPVAGGFLLFGEKTTALKIIGIVLALPAFYFSLKNEKNQNIPFIGYMLLLGAFLGTGINDFLIKYSDYHYINNDLPLFLSVVFFIAVFPGLVMSMLQFRIKKTPLKLKNLTAGILLGLINFGATYFIFRSLNILDSILVFPILNIGVVVLSALVDISLFGRRLSFANQMGFVLASMAILFITLG